MAFKPKEDGPMSNKRHKPEEIVSKLRQVGFVTFVELAAFASAS
jgi:hypothetical protein